MAVIKHKLKLNNSKIKQIEDAKKKALFETMDALKTDVIQSQVMPFDVGTMQNESTYVATSKDGKVASLITRTPYAARLYYHPEYNFQKTNNPNAQGLWLTDYIYGSKKDFCKENFAKFFKEEME
jgi:hypothetical protein